MIDENFWNALRLAVCAAALLLSTAWALYMSFSAPGNWRIVFVLLALVAGTAMFFYLALLIGAVEFYVDQYAKRLS